MRIARNFLIVSCILLLTYAVNGQTTGKAETSGPCSPAISGVNNKLTITCTGISDKLSMQLVDLMNRIAKNQVDAQMIIDKMDGCIEEVKKVRAQQQPWNLTSEQRSSFLASMNTGKFSKPEDVRISINAIGSDHNAVLMAGDLTMILRSIHWVDPTYGYTTDFTLSQSLMGITLIVTHADFPAAAYLKSVFDSSSIPLNVVIDSNKVVVKDDKTIEFAIGAKPQSD